MATKLEPFSTRAKKCSNCDSVSSVVPDLLATMNSVRERSRERSTSAIVAGWVVSRTVSSRAPGAAPKVRANISGARLEPPMPSSACVNPSPAACSANACSSGTRGHMSVARVSQPSRLAISAGSGFHTVWSLRQIRATTSSSSSRASRRATASASGPRVSKVGGELTVNPPPPSIRCPGRCPGPPGPAARWGCRPAPRRASRSTGP